MVTKPQPKPPKRRGAVFTIDMTPEERATLGELAKEKFMSASAFIRWLITRESAKREKQK